MSDDERNQLGVAAVMRAEDAVGQYFHELMPSLHDFIVEGSDQGRVRSLPDIASHIATHKAYNSLAYAVAEDGSLSKFFPILRRGTGERHSMEFLRRLQSRIVWSDGTSEGMSLLSLCAGIVGATFRILWTSTDRPTLDDVLKQLPRTLSLARRLAAKRPVLVPALVVIHNVELPEGREVSVGSATLRHPNRYDKSRVFASAPILRLDVNFASLHIRGIDPGANPDEEQRKLTERLESLKGTLGRYSRKVQDSIDMARVTLALSSPPGRFIAPVQGLLAIVNPLGVMPVASRSNIRPQQAPYPSRTIDESAEQQIAKLGNLVQAHSDKLRTGIRRLLLAMTERLDPEDGLVDAIICWENLFSGSSETTLRVCGAMAKVLGSDDDASRRRELYDRLRTLYGVRNKIVHGSSADMTETIYRDRDMAVQYVLDTLREVYVRDDLISAENSDSRGMLALLSP
jgi:hypothetical protein